MFLLLLLKTVFATSYFDGNGDLFILFIYLFLMNIKLNLKLNLNIYLNVFDQFNASLKTQ